MKVPTSDWKFLLFTAFVVFLLGLQTVRDAMEFDESAFASTADTFHEEMSRQPASLLPSVTRPTPASLRDALLEWNWSCSQSAASEVNIKGGQLRLRGKSCAASFSPDRLSIINETNGFTASVFDKGRHEYETDLIQLHEGLNRIRVQYLNSSGKILEKILTVNAVSAI